MKKFECVGHVQKRIGDRLLALKKTKLTDDSGRRVQWRGGEEPSHKKIPFFFCRRIKGKRSGSI